VKSKITIALLVYALIQLAALTGHLAANYSSQLQAISEVKQRVSLDVASLDLGIENALSVANEQDVLRYIRGVNDYLDEHAFPVRIVSIDGIGDSSASNMHYDTRLEQLSTSNENIALLLGTQPIMKRFPISYMGVALALLFLAVTVKRGTNNALSLQSSDTSEKNKTENTTNASPVLVIDLQQKALYLDSLQSPVVLSNKPFCFYVALLRYCQTEATDELVHHQAIPEKLLGYADETFLRLIELGHTKRRQPDFSSNLDKTLSEIRAALDEVYEKHPLEKMVFYPPKAQGEGSRTKRHSYALEHLNPEQYTFVFE
jgi:hypothetical protein